LTEKDPEPGYLLDTHTALWALERPEALSSAARKTVSEGPNLLSVVSYWEVTIKSMKGKLDVGDPRVWWQVALEQLAATPVLLRPEHVAALNGLPPIHQDPFDRILVKSDSDIAQYATSGFTVIV
jgi:PIN domain nuclease of toxin-antitoxin system